MLSAPAAVIHPAIFSPGYFPIAPRLTIIVGFVVQPTIIIHFKSIN
ncbi:hypothetical protein BN1221_04089 [Brenneria goodwinii]|uniref:Uncharacterized protein n=1 Tax=Brenneria goodwinii TaxID=1109412 RepID=A0A0G4K0H1_9GAMM|nr:hypothetical protein BN1221_04089 [Brenneria goodwinii]